MNAHKLAWTCLFQISRPNEGEVQRRHPRQSSSRQRPVSTGAVGTAGANASTQNISPRVNNRSSGVTTSTSQAPPPPPPGTCLSSTHAFRKLMYWEKQSLSLNETCLPSLQLYGYCDHRQTKFCWFGNLWDGGILKTLHSC